MTATTDRCSAQSSRLRRFMQGTGVIAAAMMVMNVSTYAFQMVAARALGPTQYGGVASLMALLLVLSVLQLGLQATAARRISSTPGSVAQIERVVLAVTYRSAAAVGLVMLVAAPLVWRLLRLESLVPALLVAVAVVPLTIMGGQAGVLQGERRWHALGLLYAAAGVPRLVIGAACVAIRPTEAAAMLGVTAGMVVPAVLGWILLRRPRVPEESSDHHGLRQVVGEVVHGSVALLAFFVLSNADIIVARNTLDEHGAGLYAGGLILTKAVLFLPQFVVVVAFPAMAAGANQRSSLLRSLAAVVLLGLVSTVGVVLLSGLAMIFVGGSEYGEIESNLWLFAILGTFLASLQLLVYSVLARQSRRSTYLVWIAVSALVSGAVGASTVEGLLAVVITVDAALLTALLALSLWQMRDGVLGKLPAQ